MYYFNNNQKGLLLITAMLLMSILTATGSVMLKVSNSVKKISQSTIQYLQQTNASRGLLNLISSNLDQVIQSNANSGFTWVDTSTSIPNVVGSVSAANTSIAIFPPITASLINSGTLNISNVLALQNNGVDLKDIANSVPNGGNVSIYNNSITATINPITNLVNDNNSYGGYLVETLGVSVDSVNSPSNAVYSLRISSYTCNNGTNSGTFDQSNRTCVGGSIISSSNLVVNKTRTCPPRMNVVVTNLLGLSNSIYNLYCTCAQPASGAITTTSTGQCVSCPTGGTWNDALGVCQCSGANSYFNGNASTGSGSCVTCTTGPVNATANGCTTCSGNSYFSPSTSSCVTCTGGPVNSAQNGCNTCTGNTYWNGTSCVSCATGPIENGICTTCASPNIFNSASNSCVAPLQCTGNMYWNNSSNSCATCVSGSSPGSDGQSCTTTIANAQWNNNNTITCTNGASFDGSNCITSCATANTPGASCFWMENWPPWGWQQWGGDYNYCRELDSCMGGMGYSGGGCYKWSLGVDGCFGGWH